MFILCNKCIHRLTRRGECVYFDGGDVDDNAVCDFCDSVKNLSSVELSDDFDVDEYERS